MYEKKIYEKSRDPIVELFMIVDGKIENIIEQIRQEDYVPKTEIKNLNNYKETLLEIFESGINEPKDIPYDKIWEAYNLIHKINYILEVNIKN
jgi:hypothetical protein